MKRILAVFLTLAMALNIAPMAAFAAADSDAASIVAVEETDETSSPQLDEETAKAIVSDPFLQAAYAQTEQEQQTGQAEVDTSDVTLESTGSSLSQILVNSVNAQDDGSGSYTSRVTDAKLNGNTATVKFVLDETADLVVAVYTDSTEEEMVASGTVEVSGDGGNGEKDVVLTGTIPETYTIKAYLLRKADHAPLSKTYVNTDNTKSQIDLDKATINDFDPERTINLDENEDTNFMVVRSDVGFLRDTKFETDENIVTVVDPERFVYSVTNPTEEFTSLQTGQTIVYEYGDGELLIARVQDLTVSENMVTIYSDADIRPADLFEVAKIGGTAGLGDFVYEEGSTLEENAQYLGMYEDTEATNGWDEGNVTKEFEQKFIISMHDLMPDTDASDIIDSGWSSKIDGTASLGIKLKTTVSFSVIEGKEYFSYEMPCEQTVDIHVTGTVSWKSKPLGNLRAVLYGVIAVGISPTVKFKAEGKAGITATYSSTTGFRYDPVNKIQDTSTAPVSDVDFYLSGVISVGIDLCPNVAITAANQIDFVALKLQAEGSLALNGKARTGDLGTGKDQIHECTMCYEADLTFKITFGISLKLLAYEPGVSIDPVKWNLGKIYAAPDFGEHGWGTCPHIKYRVTATIENAPAGEMLVIEEVKQANGSVKYVELGKTDGTGKIEVYLPAGQHLLSADYERADGGLDQYKTDEFTIKDRRVKVVLKKVVPNGVCGDNLKWKIENGTLEITGTGEMYKYSTLQPKPWSDLDYQFIKIGTGVTGIGSNAFSGSKAKGVDISNTVTRIGNSAFRNCANLKRVVLPDSLESIGSYAFEGCKKLGDMSDVKDILTDYEQYEIQVLPAGLKEIGKGAFTKCTSLKKVRFEGENVTLGEKVFQGCTALEQIVLPAKLDKIPQEMFKDCSSIQTIEIPETVTEIGSGAFYGCENLKDVYYTGAQYMWNAIDIYSGNEPLLQATLHCGKESDIEAAGAYENQKWTLTKSGQMTISGSGEMSWIMPDQWSKYRDKIKQVSISYGITSVAENAFSYCKQLWKVKLPSNGMSVIGEGAFSGCTSLKEIEFPEYLETLENDAFENCTSLTALDLPKNLRTIGERAFLGCKSLRSVQMGQSASKMGYGAFMLCKSLQNIKLSDYLTEIPEAAFANCEALQSIELPERAKTIGKNAFNSCTALQSITVPESVKAINRGAFAYCENLTTVQMPQTMDSIGAEAFKACSKLQSICIPEGVTTLPEKVFLGCDNLKTATLPSTLRTMGTSAFYSCNSLQEIRIPKEVSHIPLDAFSGCDVLRTVYLPVALKNVESSAFSLCRSLKNVYYAGTETAWKDVIVETGNEQLLKAKLHYGSETEEKPELPAEGGSVVATGKCGDDATWTLLDTGLLTINGTGTMEGYFEDYDGLITEKPKEWYQATELRVQGSISWIGGDAFKDCRKLLKVTMPDSVKHIDGGAFYNCNNLEEVKISAGVKEIGMDAFAYCNNLKSVCIPANISVLDMRTFEGCVNLETVELPSNLKQIKRDAFAGCKNLKEINYKGTKAQWYEIEIQDIQWSDGGNNFLRTSVTIHCTDGDILPTSTASENSITTGTASTSGSKFQATFTDAKAGKEYVVLVSRSASDPLNADNLIYINQITADADGELTVPFITAADAEEMTYVVACAQDDAPVDPDQPGEDEPSSGDDGGGAAIILIGGVAAVAAVAGVVLMMPVKVEGTVKMADQPVANATVQVLKNGNVAAQTTTDANGHFTVKVKRGGYTLRVQWTDASGQPVTRTVDFKAPNANLNVAA